MENIKKTNEMLMTSIFEVFEKMFFTFLEPLDEDEPAWEYDMVATIQFFGPHNGDMSICLTKGMAETMAENMLNVGAEDITEPLIMDISKEAVNMICGNFMRKLDLSKVYDLTIPTFERVSGTFSIKENSEKKIKVALESDGDQMGIILSLSD
jgi:CheY-specific phosphatase CheX